jgi:hypothetical protein
MRGKDRIKLTKEECTYYKEELQKRCFDTSSIALKVLADRNTSDKLKKDYFARILNGKGTLTAEELVKLKLIATCKIIDESYFIRLQTIQEHYIAGLKLFTEPVEDEVCTE